MPAESKIKKQSLAKRFLKSIGPGVITGAADDDPSGILTYSQAGSLFGYGQLWTALFSYPFMFAIQEMCGRIGIVTGRGLAGVVRVYYPKILLFFIVLILVIANTVNIGADLGAMAASLQLMIDLPFWFLLIFITIFMVASLVMVPYASYVKFLKYLTLSLLAYLLSALIVTEDWFLVFKSIFTPQIEFTKEYLFNIAAILGTTISPYLFFWQANEEVEEAIIKHKIKEIEGGAPQVGLSDIKEMRLDTGLGMFFSNAVMFFIILTVASTIGISGPKNIDSLSEVAETLRPLAGDFTFLLFTLGILGTGLLAVPILAGSAAYAVSEALGWKAGLGKKFSQAPGFYLIIILITFIGLLVNLIDINPVKMLYYAAILNGILAPVIMVLIIFISNDKKVLGEYTNSAISNIASWFITAIMTIIALSIIPELLIR